MALYSDMGHAYGAGAADSDLPRLKTCESGSKSRRAY